MDCPCTNRKNAKKVKNEPDLSPHVHREMKKENITYVDCAHCGVRIRLEEAVSYECRLLYGEHYHCRECDPDGVWDCVSHDFDTDLH